ncbi:MAG: class I SAM-dependent methyltransferase [Bacteroidetes bacterium]|nr:class I SAM-dependent methyltransferase [Bacteroidota bacterium]MBS1541168.1 class I SAM-dependent methyltransferase [Bacteroidota bacterium]
MFEPYGKEMARRASFIHAGSVLEMACGTGRVTRHLRNQLPTSVKLVASDLSPDMMNVAQVKFNQSDATEFILADMQNLPMNENSFDLVVCQFGIMFPPDKQKVFDEAYRVLKPGGQFLFSTWDKIENVGIFNLIFNEHVIPFFKGEDTSRFLVPFSLYDTRQLNNFLLHSKFSNTKLEQVVLKGIGRSAEDLVKGFFTTHSVGEEVAARNPEEFELIAERMEKEIRARFSDKPECELSAFYGAGVKR